MTLFRAALEDALASDDSFHRVTASSLERVHHDVALHAPDVVLLELDEANGAWLQLVERLAAKSDSRLVVLAPHNDGAALLSALSAGAHGFVTHAMRLHQVVAALVQTGAGEVAIPTSMLGGLLRQLIDKRRREDAAVQSFHRLSQREREVLCLLAKGNSHDSIASTLVISPQTARTHIQNVLEKLEVHSRVEAANLALEHGLVEPAMGR
jgi:DNA-binding NarL/FixJ family response regulator